MLPLSTTQTGQPKQASKCKKSERGRLTCRGTFSPPRNHLRQKRFSKKRPTSHDRQTKKTSCVKKPIPEKRAYPLDRRTKRRHLCEKDVFQKTHHASRLFSPKSAPLLSPANLRNVLFKTFSRKARHPSKPANWEIPSSR